MLSVRSWREFARRWALSVANGALRIGDVVQPVVLVDDVRELSLPPITRRWAFGEIIPAVVGQDATVHVIPNRFPILVEEVAATFASLVASYGVRPLPTPFTLGAGTPEGIGGGQNPNEFLDAEVNFGTNAISMFANNGPLMPSGAMTTVTFDPPIIVLPGEYFWWQHQGPNIAATCNRIVWRQIPVDSINWATSLKWQA